MPRPTAEYHCLTRAAPGAARRGARGINMFSAERASCTCKHTGTSRVRSPRVDIISRRYPFSAGKRHGGRSHLGRAKVAGRRVGKPSAKESRSQELSPLAPGPRLGTAWRAHGRTHRTAYGVNVSQTATPACHPGLNTDPGSEGDAGADAEAGVTLRLRGDLGRKPALPLLIGGRADTHRGRLSLCPSRCHHRHCYSVTLWAPEPARPTQGQLRPKETHSSHFA